MSRPVRVAVVGAGWAARSIWLPRLAADAGYTVTDLVDSDPAAATAAAAVVGAASDTASAPASDPAVGATSSTASDPAVGTAVGSGVGTGSGTGSGTGPRPRSALRVHTDIAALDPTAVDLAVVAVPNHAHALVAGALLRRGIAVFVEKPVCLDAAEAAGLAEAEREGGAVLLAGSAARYRSDVRALVGAAATLGDLRHVDLAWVRARGVPDGGGWFTDRRSAGGGALVDLGWHLLDAAAPLLGALAVDHVAATLSGDFVNDPTRRAGWRPDADAVPRARPHGDVEDTVRAFLVTADGVSVSLRASWASHEATDTTVLTVEGSGGVARLRSTFGFSPNRVSRPSLTTTTAGVTTAVELPDEPVGTEYDHQLAELPALLRDPASRGAAIAEAHRAVALIDRIYTSARHSATHPPAVPAPAPTAPTPSPTGVLR